MLADMVRMYDAAVRRLDGKIKHILSRLETLGLADHTTLFVTADHGEEFLEHGKIGHGQALYEELTHVPLVMHGPGAPRGEICDQPTSQVDLARTILDVAGVDTDFPGANILTAERSAIVSELRIRRRLTQTLQVDDLKLHRFTCFDIPDEGLTDTRPLHEWAQLVPYEQSHELFNLSVDPREKHDIATAPQLKVAGDRLIAQLDEWWATTGPITLPRNESEFELDEDVVARLRDLGYID
jgi:arylsulfatase A-like enzyme